MIQNHRTKWILESSTGCGAYVCLIHDCTHFSGVYKTVYQADVSKDYDEEDPWDLGIYWYLGEFFDFIGGDKTNETGAEDVTETGT